MRLMVCLLTEKQNCILGILADHFLVSERQKTNLFRQFLLLKVKKTFLKQQLDVAFRWINHSSIRNQTLWISVCHLYAMLKLILQF